jgi:hypothetical protein
MMVNQEATYIRIIKGFYIGCGGYLLQLPSSQERARVKVWYKQRAKCFMVNNDEYITVEPFYMKIK